MAETITKYGAVDIADYTNDRRATISFHHISYTITETSCCYPFKCGEPQRKEILKNVSGVIQPGLNAIMGPTGSGKTSLLDVLAKRKDPAWLSGKVLMNSKKLPNNYKYLSGYVVQNDILKASMTVRESFWFSANMRLQPDVTYEEKKQRIEKLLEQLGLQKCADTRIGNDFVRGISGGERKRTSIGLEIITNPRVLYVDEPTTGLDASTANTVMLLLKKISAKGIIIVVSIHQPRFSIFKLFDSLTLLSLGQCVYHGQTAEAEKYFNSLGYVCEYHNNPADFFLDVIDCEVDSLGEHYKKIDFEYHTKHERHVKVTNKLRQSFLQTEQNKILREQLQNIENHFDENKEKRGESFSEYSTPFLWQLKHLVRRDVTNIIRSPQGVLSQVIINLVLAVACGLLYLQLDLSASTGPQNRFGLFFFITTNLLFSSITVIAIFIQDKALFKHEYVSGYYGILSYFLSKVVAEIISMSSLCPLMFALTTYWMAGLKITASAFLIYVLVTTILAYASVALAMLFSVWCTDISTANFLLSNTYVFSYVFSGLLVNIEQMPTWLSWLQYFSIARYGMAGISINEFSGEVYSECHNTTNNMGMGSLANLNATPTFENNQTCVFVTGEEYLLRNIAVNSIDGKITPWTLWQNVVALFCITIALFSLTYIQLVRSKKFS